MRKIGRILLFVFFLFIYSDVYAYEKYKLDDFVYFDPINDNKCNSSNYWTIYNKDTTCYRFFVIDLDDDVNSSTLKIMLDHDVGYDNYNNYHNVLNDISSKWIRYDGIIDIIDEETIYKIMKLNEKPTLEKIGVNGGYASPLATNSFYIHNGKKINYNGFWSKDLYEEDNNYAYTMNEYGTNTIVLRSKKRGIRPVLEIDKSLLVNDNKSIDISNMVSSSKQYNYEYPNQTYGDNLYYKQLQGFTFAKDKFVFYATNDLDSDNGLLISYSGNNYNILNKIDYGSTGHGNDITYNSKKNKVLVVGPSEYREIYMYNGDTLSLERKYNASDLNNAAYYAIAYDDINNKYLAVTSRKVFLLDENFKQLYSFDVSSTIYASIIQGMEYQNGYLYLTTASTGCPNPHHLYCFYPNLSSNIYVYDVKLNENGTPVNSFGKLVERFYINKNFGELEGISFKDKNVFLGYASHMYDKKYTFKFYSFPYDKIDHGVNYKVLYKDYGIAKNIVISSTDKLKKVDGWTLSNDKHTLSKLITTSMEAFNVKICNRYNNCSNVSIEEQSINMVDNIFQSSDGKQIYTVDILYNVKDFKDTIDYDGKINIFDKDNKIKDDKELIATGDLIKIYDNYNNNATFSLYGIGKVFEVAACYKDYNGKYIWGKYEKESLYTKVLEVTEEKKCNNEIKVLLNINDISGFIIIPIIIMLIFGSYLIYYVYNTSLINKKDINIE